MAATVPPTTDVPMTVVTHFHLTGFGEFRGVLNNPTEQLMQSLPSYLAQHPLPAHICVESLSVLETSGAGSRRAIAKLNNHATDACTPVQTDDKTVHAQVYLHFGVHAGSKFFKLESTAYNLAAFRVPDQLGWQPLAEAIVAKGPSELRTTLDLTKMNRTLSCFGDECNDRSECPSVAGVGVWKCVISTDPGRFVCNWAFYNSLHRSRVESNTHSLFVHVPSHDVYDLPDQQRFARDVILAIDGTLQLQSNSNATPPTTTTRRP